MASFPKINAYTRNQPEAVLPPAPIVALRAPTANDINYPLGQIWVNKVAATTYILARVASNIAVWAQATTGAGDIDSLTADNAVAALPVGGNVNLLGDGTTISTSAAGDTILFALVADPEITGMLTVDNGIDVLAGGIAVAGGMALLGTTNINVSGAASTNIGSGTNTGTVTIGNSASSGVIVVGPTAINNAGAENTLISAGGNTGTVTIGSTASTAIELEGPVFINTSVNANTAINTGTSTGTVTIGTLANAGGVSINSAAASNFTTSGAGIDLTLSSVLGSVIVSATEVAANAIQLTTAATGGITVNASSAAMLVHRAVNVDAAAGINAFTSTSLTTGVAGVFTSSAATVDSLRADVGGIRVAPVVPAGGASPLVASARFGVASFTDNIVAAATVALAITNTMATATSHIIATAQCVTVGSAVVIRNIDVSVAGTITCNVTNLGGTDTGAGATVITFWLLD